MPQIYIDTFGLNSFTAPIADNWQILGLTGNDTLTGNSLADIIEGGVGNDRLFGLGGNDVLNGGDGDDFLDGGSGDDYVSGEIGNDTLFGSLGSDFFNGGAGTDVANYSSFGSSITLLPTGSILKGGGGTDQLFQVETIIANAGFSNNTIDASGAASPASINVNLGALTNNLQVVGGPVLTFTVTNFDDVIGTNQSDVITGDGQANILSGNAGNDLINGGLGNDSLTGGFGNDTLNGGIGNDILLGGVGADDLTGGIGNDLIYLGANDNAVDTVRYTAGHGIDTIYQFVRGMGGDKLNFTGIANFDVITSGTSTLVRVGDGIGGNTGFGTSQLLVTLSGTSGFTSANANLNLFGGNFLFN
jgi:Ca2+-binding RTX toxin-like protein